MYSILLSIQSSNPVQPGKILLGLATVVPVLGLNRRTHSVSLLGTASLGHKTPRRAMGLALKAPSLGPRLGLAQEAPSLNKGEVEGLTPLLLSPILDTATWPQPLRALPLGLALLAPSLGKRVTIPDSFTNLGESPPCLRVGIWRSRMGSLVSSQAQA